MAKKRSDKTASSPATVQPGTEAPHRMPYGWGSMRDMPLNIDPRIDLTKPIYEQVLALRKADEEEQIR